MGGTAKIQVLYGLPPLGPAQDVVIGAGPLSSNAFAATTVSVLLCSTSDCRIAINANPTATATSTLLPAGVPLPVRVEKGAAYKVSVMQESAAGKLSITELPE